MFDFFKKKETPQPKKASSLFASDSIPRFKRDFAEELHRITFQKTITDFKAVDSKGNQIALDGQTIGNPNGLKPFIEPVTNVPYAQMLWYASQSFIGYQLCALLSQNWLINKACIMPARDATRHGYELVTHDGQEIEEDVLAFIKHVDKHRYRINTNLINLVRFNRVFGIRIALFDIETEDETFYENPFNIDGVRPYSYKGISQVDPYWITPELDMNSASNPASIDFYEPTWWRVNGKRYHKSHLIVLRNSLVPDVLKPTYLYGGLSIPQMIAERVFASEKTANEAPQLAMTKRTNVFKTDIEAAISDQASFEQKLQWYAQMRDNYGMKVIGQDDAIEQHDISLADLDSIIMTQYQLVAAIAEVPATKLLGTSPKGFNATGEFEQDDYHEFLESIQENDMNLLLDRHYLLLNKSEIMPKFDKNFKFTISWNPVDTPTAKEQAEINLIKAQSDQALIEAGSLSGEDIRNRIIKDKDSGYSGVVDETPPDDEVPPEKRTLRIEESNADQPVSKED